jgi:hypothetical protein
MIGSDERLREENQETSKFVTFHSGNGGDTSVGKIVNSWAPSYQKGERISQKR